MRRVGKWVGLVACVAIAAAMVASCWWRWSMTYYPAAKPYGEDYSLALEQGCVAYRHPWNAGRYEYPARVDYDVAPAAAWSQAGDPSLFCLPFWHRSGSPVTMPLWVGLLPLAALTAHLWYRDRAAVRWRLAGRCVRCGYDRRGLNVDSPCPECGAARPG